MGQARRRHFLIAAGMFLAVRPGARAQQATKVFRVGFVSSGGSPSQPWPSFEAFRQRMAELGYVEGRNLLIEHRYGAGRLDRLPDLVREVLRRKVDVFVAANNVAIQAAKKATREIPIVMVSSIDPVAASYVDSLARPGGNITGLSYLGRDLSAKRLEILKEILPGISRVAILWDEEGPGPRVAFEEYRRAARVLGLRAESLNVRGPSPDIEGAFQAADKLRTQALVIVENPLIGRHLSPIFRRAAKSRLPSMNENGQFVESGGLVSYGADRLELFRRAADYVDRILKGAKPAALPVEQPIKFELVVNLKTAKVLGVSIPRSVLLRADRVIE